MSLLDLLVCMLEGSPKALSFSMHTQHLWHWLSSDFCIRMLEVSCLQDHEPANARQAPCSTVHPASLTCCKCNQLKLLGVLLNDLQTLGANTASGAKQREFLQSRKLSPLECHAFLMINFAAAGISEAAESPWAV